MLLNKKLSIFRLPLAAACLIALVALAPAKPTIALGSPDSTQKNSYGLEGRISSPPPTQAATIVAPANGQTVSTTPITVAGFCKTGLMVKIFSNNVFVGSVLCQNGSYSLKVDLFSGRNEIVARVYDTLDQAGPDSNLVTVTFNDAQYAQFGTRVSLSSNYARRGANPGVQLDWPIILSGGNGPYAVSVDWGDGSAGTLVTQAFAGEFNISHTYATAGSYAVVVKASDSNGTTSYLQLVGIANGQSPTTIATGQPSSGINNGGSNSFLGTYGWYILLAIFPLMILTFWLGSRHELYVVRRRIEHSRLQN